MFRNKICRYAFYFILIIPLLGLMFYIVYLEKENKNEFFDMSFIIGEQEVQRIKAWAGEDNIYYVFLPAETEKIELELEENQRFRLNDKLYKDGELIDVFYGDVYDAQIQGKGKRLLKNGQIIFLKADNVPTVYIEANCSDTDIIVEQKETKTDIFISTFNSDGSLDFTGECSIKGRGNSSWEKVKKPYNLTFAEAETLLGMGAQRKWALLTSWADTTLLKNEITTLLASKWGLEYTPEMEYVNLYVNGNYQGMYLLTQKIAAQDGCITWDENQKNVLFERDARYDEESTYIETEHCGILYESTQLLNWQDISFYTNMFTDLETLLFNDGTGPILEECSEFIDVESWIKLFMVEEFIANVDMEFASRYYYLKSDSPLLYAGPMWDHDFSMGTFSLIADEFPPCIVKYEDVEDSYFKQLMQHEDFKAEFVKYYQEEFRYIIDEVVYQDLPNCIKYIETSMKMNNIRWDSMQRDAGGVDFVNDSAKVKEWLEQRAIFWKEYWGDNNEFCRVVFKDGGGVYYMKKGEVLSYFPQHHWYKKTRWFDENGEELFPGMTVTQDMEFYPEYYELKK